VDTGLLRLLPLPAVSDIADGGVDPRTIVIAFDISEQFAPCGIAIGVFAVVGHLGFQSAGGGLPRNPRCSDGIWWITAQSTAAWASRRSSRMLESLSPCRLQAFLPARNYSADPIALAPTTASGEHLREVEDVPDDFSLTCRPWVGSTSI